ncbi:MAG: adenylosuccinate lyase [Anaerolineaceae bacterium]|nr:adenylosuccinate lyase [Anaerolineaceae bacterium]
MTNPYDNYQSPFSWRYASPEMRSLWSENYKRRLWRKIWVALAQVQSEFGLFPSEMVTELATHVNEIDVEAAIEIESQIHHDLMAELKVFAAQCPNAGGILHMGATSMDIEDNADALRQLSAMDLILVKLGELLLAFADRIEETVNIPVIAFTHLQPAEPTTLGYRFAFHAQDILGDWQNLKQIRDSICGKGFKGAVGTGAAFGELVELNQLDQFEQRLSEILDLQFFPITHQTYPRKQDLSILNALSALGASLYKFAFDLRILQSPPIGELSEPFAKQQVGSSAMPFKRNPINSEKIDSLARQLSLYPQIAWQNAANSLLERTLDDSANRRTILPESFLITDELLKVSLKLIKGLNVNQDAIKRNLETYAPFAMTERIMMVAGKKGANRQEMHELLRQHALVAWEAIQRGQPNPLIQNLQKEPVLQNWISPEEIQQLSELNTYVGFAKERAKTLVEEIRSQIQ